MIDIEEKISKYRKKLDQWLSDSYGDEYGNFNGEHDIDYDGWVEIENLLKEPFESNRLKSLSEACLNDILFFISRSEEGGRIIAWLYPDQKQLSNIADLPFENFIVLCEHALKSTDDYCDYQFANCFQKFENLTPKLEKLLIGFFKKKYIYTKRLSLISLAKHKFPELERYIVELWETNDEWAGLNCIHALKTSGCNDDLFKKYRAILLNSNDKYIRENARKI